MKKPLPQEKMEPDPKLPLKEEIDLLRQKAEELILQKPEKAVIILTRWIHHLKSIKSPQKK